ncbi:MAG: copper resistance protein CopC [Candidatus Pristimantibacillus sp.]
MYRKQVLFMLSVVIFLVFPQLTFAHTKLEASSPEVNETVTQELKELTLEFNTEVEPLSSFKLINGDGEEVPASKTEIKEKRMVGSFEKPIPNGSYTVRWKIVGRDGHPIEGDYDFKVDALVKELTPEPTSEQQAEDTPSTTKPSPQSLETPAKSSTDQQTSGQDREQSLIWIIAGVIIIAFIVLIFGRRRKR